VKKIKEYIAHFRWVIASQRFKKERFKNFAHFRWVIASQRFKRERFKKGRGEDFHHE